MKRPIYYLHQSGAAIETLKIVIFRLILNNYDAFTINLHLDVK